MRLAAASPRPRAGPAARPWQAPVRPCPDRVISVNTTDDELNSDGDCSLREAIEAANTNTVVDGCVEGCRDDTIFVPSGTYTLTIPGAGEDNNQTGDLDILDNAYITGDGSGLTMLDGNNLDRLLDILPGRTVVVNDLTVTHGRVYDENGGGIRNQGILTLNHVTLYGNAVVSALALGGGGLGNQATPQDASATLNNCLVMTNTAPIAGGLLNVGWLSFVAATLTVNHTTIRDNSASLWAGGLYNGEEVNASDTVATMILSESLIENNTALSGYGNVGGVDNVGWPESNCSATLTVERSTIRNNVAASECDYCGFAGGIRNALGTLVVRDSTISGNTASGTGFGGGEGGGLFIISGAATLANSTVSGNQTSGSGLANMSGIGGGIAIITPYAEATLVLTSTTIAKNSTNVGGGGIASVNLGNGIPTIAFKSNIIDDNGAPPGTGQGCTNPDIGYGIGTIISLGYNIEDYNYCGFSQLTDLPSTDALLYPLTDNGGGTQTHALLRGSPAIDRGSCPDFAVDQRGLPRPVDIPGIPDAADGCDIGAYELQSLSLIDLTKTVGTDPTTCADTHIVFLPLGGGDVTYCYQVENSGTVTLTLHELWDDQLGQLLDQPYELQPGETRWLTTTAAITETTVNQATWMAYNPGSTDVISATDTATVVVRLPYEVYLPLVARSGP
jgi:CSLREA domain-containing protein